MGEVKNRICLCMMRQYCKIAEISNAADAATLLDHSEDIHGGCGGYKTADDELNLPYCTTYAPPINDVISQVDVLEEMNKNRDGRDLDDNRFDIQDLENFRRDVKNSRLRYLVAEYDGIYQVGDKEKYYVLLKVGDTVDPYLIKTPKVLDDWVHPTPNDNKGETHFSEVKNPGICISFDFRPDFESGRYKAHCSPTECVPVPNNGNI